MAARDKLHPESKARLERMGEIVGELIKAPDEPTGDRLEEIKELMYADNVGFWAKAGIAESELGPFFKEYFPHQYER